LKVWLGDSERAVQDSFPNLALNVWNGDINGRTMIHMLHLRANAASAISAPA
jgi:hypothetical protein